MQIDYKLFSKYSRAYCVLLGLISILAFTTMFSSQGTLSWESSLFNLAMMILNHVIYLQVFQITLFVRNIQIRLKAILNEFNLNQNPEKLFEMKELFVLLHKANVLLNNCFKWPLLINFMQLYYNLLSNFYWFGMAILDLYSARIIGKFDKANRLSHQHLPRRLKLFQMLSCSWFHPYQLFYSLLTSIINVSRSTDG